MRSGGKRLLRNPPSAASSIELACWKGSLTRQITSATSYSMCELSKCGSRNATILDSLQVLWKWKVWPHHSNRKASNSFAISAKPRRSRHWGSKSSILAISANSNCPESCIASSTKSSSRYSWNHSASSTTSMLNSNYSTALILAEELVLAGRLQRSKTCNIRTSRALRGIYSDSVDHSQDRQHSIDTGRHDLAPQLFILRSNRHPRVSPSFSIIANP